MKVITTNPMSMESFKASISKAADEGEATLQKEGITEKKKEEVRGGMLGRGLSRERGVDKIVNSRCGQ